MNVFYVILTCDAYRPTRCEWQKDTWLKHVPRSVFLGCKERPDQNMVGWNTTDDYDSCPIKLMRFLQNYELPEGTDWIVFADDDTFMFPERLNALLFTLNPNRSLYVGSHCNDEWLYMSGGAGFVVSRTLFERLREYTRSQPDKALHVAKYSDKSFGDWVFKCGGMHIVDERFHGNYSETFAESCISCHYVTKDGMYFLNRFLPE
jgi:hypothetical protein